ncbi:hypothetical protein [Halocatena pleomorpha]|uniref:Uncharacterized protein n=1 Tax=Halocatena pleomorpha TaxID=1785090 RepID=A0A3P3R7X2_9EURY|nr:hypothetical protein [Halocatena pleomorpha]RRJ28730.1 hypothetical protein EIK79_15130 [Halocatena pleomorpha]
MKGASIIVFIGLIIIVGGFMMPSTQTSTVNGCIEGEYGITGDSHCSGIESSAEVTTTNPTKAPTIGFGILLVIIGSVRSYSTGLNNGISNNNTILRVSGKVTNMETGKTTTLVLPVHTDSIEVATKRFRSRCKSEEYELIDEPDVVVESRSQGISDTNGEGSINNINKEDNLAVRRWKKSDGALEKLYLIAIGILVLWLVLIVVPVIIISLI